MIFPKPKPLPERMDIPGFDGRYYVCIDGTVWHRWKSKDTMLYGHQRKHTKWLKLTDASGKVHVKTLSWVMRHTYFAGITQDQALMHRNGLRTDFSVHNLQVVDRATLGRKRNRSERARAVMKCDPNTLEALAVYKSAREAGRTNYMSYQTILDCCNMKNKKRKGIAPDGFAYRWEGRKHDTR